MRYSLHLGDLGWPVLRIGLVAMPLIGVWSGCSEGQDGNWFSRTFRPRSPAEDLRLALEANSPDERRKAVLRIGNGRERPPDAVFAVLSTVARTDSHSSVRCAAIRALTHFMEERAVEPLIMLLLYEKHPKKVFPPGARVRWDTILAISQAKELGLIPDEEKAGVRVELIRTLLSETDRNVRMASADALGEFFHRDVVEALIGALREEDFGIVYAAEGSLVALTGVTHQYDADAWLAWLKQTEDPFANAGLIPEGYDRKPKNRWRQAWNALNE